MVSRVPLVPFVLLLSSAPAGAQTSPPGVRFTDVASALKFSYVTNNDFRGRKYFPQPMCGGVAIFDFDRDGWMDIYFTNGAKLPELQKTDPSFYHCLLKNRGDGTFEDVTAAAGLLGENLDFTFGVAAGDYDNDGFPDLFIAAIGRNVLYHNNGDGTFTDVTEQSGIGVKPPKTISVQGAWLDYDNDGWLDLIVSNYTLWTPEEDIVCRMNSGLEYYCNPKNYEAVPHRLYRNRGDGTFEDVTEEAGFAEPLGKGMGIAIADFNKDGRQDIFVANDTEPNFLYINQGDGTFREAALEFWVAYNDAEAVVSAMGADAKDFDNDGWVDIFYNNLMTQHHALFRNLGGKEFDYISRTHHIEELSRHFSGWSNGFIDYDNDGWKDIYSANGDVDYFRENAEQHDTMWRNIEGRFFEDVSASLGSDFLRKGYQRGAAFGDLNNDGFLDIVVTSLGKRPRILLNSADNGNHWLIVALEGRRSNRDAIGAEVKLTTASGRTLYNHVTTSVGFISSSDPRLHFGLGAEDKIQSLEIRWPSGIRQVIRNPKADRILRIAEPGR